MDYFIGRVDCKSMRVLNLRCLCISFESLSDAQTLQDHLLEVDPEGMRNGDYYLDEVEDAHTET